MVLKAAVRPRFDIQKGVLLGIIAAIVIVLTVFSPNYLSTRNLTNILLQVAVVVIVASAANLLMYTGNFDLSIGSVLAFSGILYAFLAKHGFSLPAAAVTACLAAASWGAINGLTVGFLRITPVIATMGTMYAARGLAFILARLDGGSNISTGLPVDFSDFGRYMLFGQIPIVILIMIAVVFFFDFIERRSPLGRYAYAIGDNPSAARLSGVRVTGIVFALFMIVSALAGFCGVFQVSRVGLAAPNIAQGLEFDVVVAMVLGGTSMLGGEGSMRGMILGALVVGLTSNGLNLLGVSFFYQEIVKGLLLIAAVYADQRVRRFSR